MKWIQGGIRVVHVGDPTAGDLYWRPQVSGLQPRARLIALEPRGSSVRRRWQLRCR
jgi:hypothetical protein